MEFALSTGIVSVRLPGCQALRRWHARCCPCPVSAPSLERSPLGCHRKPSRIRLTPLLPGAAVPALAGMAAVCLAPQAQAEPVPAHTAAQPAAVTDAAAYAGVSSAPLLAVTARATGRHRAGSARPVRYTVRPGDSLSAIAGRVYHKPDAWPVLYWANHSQVRWANIITAGQVLQIPAEPAKIPGGPARGGRAGQPGVRTRAGRTRGGKQLLGGSARRRVRSVRRGPRVRRER